MIFWYAVLFVSFFLIALILRLNRSAFQIVAERSVGLVNELLSDQDEDTKIKQIQKSNSKLILSLLKMFLVVLFAFVLGSIPVLLYCLAKHATFSSLVFSSLYSILFISLGATVPFLIPFRKKSNSSYSELSQLLHRMALNNYYISYKLFKKEAKKIRRKNLERQSKFVIVSGLARAGTTSLMNDLSQINDFKSLSYANMPFLLCPNIWAKFYKPKSNKLQERSHKDGIMIGLNSNEALEEYFFKVKANDSYIKEFSLEEYQITQDDYNDYLDYQSIVKLDNNKIYLTKNNNFILRYRSLREFNNDFLMVILFRDPLSHASSLMEKHHEYKLLQQEDPFVLEYMNWLGHHEFGENQKPFVFSSSERIQEKGKDSLDYWLNSWINYYRYVLTINHPNTVFVSYDRYCKDPKGTIETLLKKMDLSTEIPDYKSFINRRMPVREYSGDLLELAQEIYRQLGLKSNTK